MSRELSSYYLKWVFIWNKVFGHDGGITVHLSKHFNVWNCSVFNIAFLFNKFPYMMFTLKTTKKLRQAYLHHSHQSETQSYEVEDKVVVSFSL